MLIKMTTDGREVCGGLFKYVGTHGLPLEMILQEIERAGAVMDWVNYITDALRDGHKIETIRARISEATADIYGPFHRDEVLKRIELLVGNSAST